MSWKSSRGERNGGQLLRDIETISEALYVHKTLSKALTTDHGHNDSCGDTRVSKSSSNVASDSLLRKQKKSSIWNWRPLKALAHIGYQRFNCCFVLHVHAIEGLPINFKDLALYVNWERKGEMMRTRPALVCEGTAEFEETLTHSCSVYGSKTGHQHSAKYEPKLSLLRVCVVGAPALDIGKHWVDLTRLLPLTLDELEEGRRDSGKWSTSFKLSGKAKGAMLNVSFRFSVLQSYSTEPSPFVNCIKPAGIDHFSERDETRVLQRLGSVPSRSADMTHLSSRSLDASSLDKVLSDRKLDLSQSFTILCKKLDEGKLEEVDELDFFHKYLKPPKPSGSTLARSSAESIMDDQHIEFAFSELGIEHSASEQLKPELCSCKSFDDAPIENTEDRRYICNEKGEYNQNYDANRGEHTMMSIKYEEPNVSMFDEIESEFLDLLNVESEVLDSSLEICQSVDRENYMNLKSSYKSSRRVKSLSLDDVAESVANDFLDMLNFEQTLVDLSSDGCPDSPREQLLREFEKEALSSGNSIFDHDATADDQVEFSSISSSAQGRVACSDDFDFGLSSATKDLEKQHERGTQSLRSKRNMKMIEHLETEALMGDWGLDERAFQQSPRISSGAFGSPIYLSPERRLQLPPLGEGLGTNICMPDGGFLCSMDPQLFRNARYGLRLIIQFSGPVVLPAAMGCSGMEILSCWASGGISIMSVQAETLMPLEDITGKNIQEISREAGSRHEQDERFSFWHGLAGTEDNGDLLFHQSLGCLNSTSVIDGVDLGFVSMEDLAPLLKVEIEPLTIEGLRVQSNLSDKEAPSSIKPHFNQVFGPNGDDEGDLVELSVSPDEWLRLDAGDFGNKSETKERIVNTLVAHHAKSIDLDSLIQATGEERLELGRKCGQLGNNLTLALRVQLRDPLRDYETVGSSMLILIQLERSCVPTKQYTRSISSERNSCSGNDLQEQFISAGETERVIHRQAFPEFKITEVLVAGFGVEPTNEPIWRTKRQQHAGSRWLLSSGIGRIGKRQFAKSNAIVRSSSQIKTNEQPEDILWSISSDFHVRTSKRESCFASNVHTRNPDIIFPTEGCPKPVSWESGNSSC